MFCKSTYSLLHIAESVYAWPSLAIIGYYLMWSGIVMILLNYEQIMLVIYKAMTIIICNISVYR